MKELAIRTVTGSVYVIILLGAPLLGSWVFFVVFLLLTSLTLREFFRLSKLEGASPVLVPGILMGLWLFVQQFLKHELGLSLSMETGFLALALILFIIELFRDHQTPFLNLGMMIMGTVYIGIPMGLLPSLLYFDTITYHPVILIFILTVIWVHDTGAYLVGISFGKTPLIKKISPKKTVEGLVGGIVLGFIAVWVFSHFSDFLDKGKLFLLAFVIMVFANLGDLFESKWKRHLGIKDSGKSLPGHGGWLDRLDSFLMALPAVYLILEFIV